jgi:hypothetical protein
MGKKLKDSACSSRNYPDYQLRLIAAQVMGMEKFDEEAFMRQVDDIRILDDWMFEFHFSDGRIATWEKA